MIKFNNKIKFIFLKKKISLIKKFNKNLIKKSIIQNQENSKKIKCYLKVNFDFLKIIKKNCLLQRNIKTVQKKSKFSRYVIHKLNNSNLNQNIKIYEK